MKTILLLGSGELGREFTIACKRYGHRVVACDKYADAPAMQVADEFRVFDMLSAEDLQRVVDEVNPDIIVPEIEAIRTEKLFDFEKRGIHVVPSANATNKTMNRRAIRDLASQELGLRTAKYRYATTQEEFVEAVQEIGIPCVVKPLMSSSGKGQSTVNSAAEVQQAWDYALEGARVAMYKRLSLKSLFRLSRRLPFSPLLRRMDPPCSVLPLDIAKNEATTKNRGYHIRWIRGSWSKHNSWPTR